jgi:hypothetical protein
VGLPESLSVSPPCVAPWYRFLLPQHAEERGIFNVTQFVSQTKRHLLSPYTTTFGTSYNFNYDVRNDRATQASTPLLGPRLRAKSATLHSVPPSR